MSMRMVKLASAIALLAVVLLLWSLQGSDDERAARHAGDTPGAQPEQADLPPEQVSGADLRPVPLPPLDTAIPPNPPDESGRPAAGQAETDADHQTWEVLVLGARKQPAIGIRMTLLENRAFSRGLGRFKLITDVQGRATFRGDESGFYLSFDGGPERSWHINQPKTVIRLADLIPARVLVRNAETGQRPSKTAVFMPGEREPLPLRGGYYEFTVFRGEKYEAELIVL
ncbi:MAG: hypothetical protein O7C98_10595, partial [Planctomycetota bacterium]|nr:hypothetical protein [Planctomycetota bacterium]